MTEPPQHPGAAPGEDWPFDRLLRWLCLLLGVLWLGVANRGLLILLVFGLGFALAGFLIARMDADRRRRWRAEWLGTYGDDDRRRWLWRGFWLLVAVMLATVFDPTLPVYIAAWVSFGWIVSDVIDFYSSQGRAEAKEWEQAKRRWDSYGRQRQFEEEWGWARAFESYELYRTARAERPGKPIHDLDFAAAKRGEPPPPRYVPEGSE